MNNKKLIGLFIITLCILPYEALAKKSTLNNNDLFLNKSDIPKTFTTPNQEALDNLNKKLHQEAAHHHKQNLKPNAADIPMAALRTPYQEAVNNYNKNLSPNAQYGVRDRDRNRIDVPILRW